MMALPEPRPTPYDLRFTLLRVPVRVDPWFWLVTGLFGLDILLSPYVPLWLRPPLWLVWMACAFVSLLAHEFGHALAARRYGLQPHVILYAFGGLAGWFGVPLTRGQKIVVALAGPGAGFALCLAVHALWLGGLWPRGTSLTEILVADALGTLWFINLYWNLLNLLPVWPLDGGQVSRELLNAADRRRGERMTFGLGMWMAGVVAVGGLLTLFDALRPAGWRPMIWLTVLFGLLAWQNWKLYQLASGRGWMSDRLPWEK